MNYHIFLLLFLISSSSSDVYGVSYGVSNESSSNESSSNESSSNESSGLLLSGLLSLGLLFTPPAKPSLIFFNNFITPSS